MILDDSKNASQCINRNIVECKVLRSLERRSVLRVLIETLWNVKISEFADSGGAINSINRNIVECKEVMRMFF